MGSLENCTPHPKIKTEGAINLTFCWIVALGFSFTKFAVSRNVFKILLPTSAFFAATHSVVCFYYIYLKIWGILCHITFYRFISDLLFLYVICLHKVNG